MRIEIIHHQHDFLGMGVMKINDLTHKQNPVLFGAPLAHLHLTGSCFWFHTYEEATHSFPFIFVVHPLIDPFFHRKWLSGMSQKLFTSFIQTQLWKTLIIRTLVDLQHIFHVIDKVRIRFCRDAEGLLQPGFEFILFNVTHTVWWLI